MRYGCGFRFNFGLPPSGFWFRGPGYFPRREEYIRMLEEYKREFEAELKDVEKAKLIAKNLATPRRTTSSSYGLA